MNRRLAAALAACIAISALAAAGASPATPPPRSQATIAFAASAGHDPRLKVIATDGSGLHSIGGAPAARASAQPWSPDGRRVVYSDGSGLLVVGAHGGTPRRLTQDAGGEDAVWSSRRPLDRVGASGTEQAPSCDLARAPRRDAAPPCERRRRRDR